MKYAVEVNTVHDGVDWLFSADTDAEGNIISCGYTSDTAAPYNNEIVPSILIVDPKLQFRRHNKILTWYDAETEDNISINGGYSNFQEVRALNDGYLAAGYARVNSNDKPAVARFNSDGDLTDSLVFFSDDTQVQYRIYAMRECYGENGNRFFLLAGHKANKWFIMRINNNLEFMDSSSIEDPTNSGSFLPGNIRGMCLDYPNGSNPGSKPVVEADFADHVVLTGFRIKTCNEINSFVCYTTVVIRIKFPELDNSETAGTSGQLIVDWPSSNSYYEYSCESGGYYDTYNTFDYTDFPGTNWPCSTQTFIGQHNIITATNQKAVSSWPANVEQNRDGNFILSNMANYTRLGSGIWSSGMILSPLYQHEIDDRLPDDLYSSLIVLHGYNSDFDETATPKTIGHASGMDYISRAHFDWDGNIYVNASIADTLIALPLKSPGTTDFVSNHALFKATLHTSGSPWTFNREWFRAALGAKGQTSSQSGRGCSFDHAITQENDIVLVGDNQHRYPYSETYNGKSRKADNYELLLFNGDCYINAAPELVQIGSNSTLNGIPVFSVAAALTPPNTELTWTGDQFVNTTVVVENGYTLVVTGSTTYIRFLDLAQLNDTVPKLGRHSGIIVQAGGKLVVKEGATLTGLGGDCKGKWDGILLGEYVDPIPLSYAEMVLENGIVEHARVGVDVYKGKINAYNGDPCADDLHFENITNFINNNISVRYNMGWADGSLSRFKYINFESNAAFWNSGKGFHAFVVTEGVNGLVFRGCSFTNSYTGQSGLCAGVVSNNSGIDFIPAPVKMDIPLIGCDYPPYSGCELEGRPNSFTGLWTGIYHGGNTGGNRMRVCDAEFTDCREAIMDVVSNTSFIYSNEISWTEDYNDLSFAGGAYKYGVFNTWAYGAKVMENTIYNEDTDDFLAIYSEQVAWDAGYGGERVRKNNVENALEDPLGTAQKTWGNDSFLQITCNTYVNMAQDWEINGQLENQGNSTEHNTNLWTSSCTGSQSIDASGLNRLLSYFAPSSSVYEPDCNTNVGNETSSDVLPCSALDPCVVYNDTGDLVYDEETENWEIIALSKKNPVEGLLDRLGKGEIATVRAELRSGDLSAINTSKDYKDILLYFETILPAFEQQRRFELRHEEISVLRALARADNYTARLAGHSLFYYAGIRSELPGGKMYNAQRAAFGEMLYSERFERGTPGVWLYPNPATGHITLQAAESQTCSVRIYELSGREILRFNRVLNGQKMDISTLSSGIYITQVYDDRGLMFTQRIIK